VRQTADKPREMRLGSRLFHSFVCNSLCVAGLVAAPTAKAQGAAAPEVNRTEDTSAPAASPVPKRTVNSFADVRSEVLNLIGGAQRRIWLMSDFLSDGEIVSALYVAQYRKVEVQVLLGRAKSNAYMSRLNYLKAQNITVFLRPPQFQPNIPSAVLADDQLLLVNGELDFLARNRRFEIDAGPSPQVRTQFIENFAAAVQRALPASARPLPLVGRSRAASGEFRGKIQEPETSVEVGDPADGFRYSRVRQPPPAGVPTKLPRTTIWQERARERDAAGRRNPDVRGQPAGAADARNVETGTEGIAADKGAGGP